MSTPEYDEINFTCPESFSSNEEQRLFYLFAEAFNSVPYTKEDLVEHIQRHGFNPTSLLTEVIIRDESGKYGIPRSVSDALSEFASFVGIKEEVEDLLYFVDGYIESDEDDFLYELTEGMRHYEDEESFLSAWGDKTSYLEFIAFKSLRGFIASYPETINLEKDEDDYDQDLEIDSWYDDVALPKLDPFLIAIKDQFEQHQQKKAQVTLALKQALLSNQTIDELLKEGYIGVDYELADDFAFAAAAHMFKDKIKWTQTQPDEDGDVALMTPNLVEFDELLDYMLDKFGWCPKVYSTKESPEIFVKDFDYFKDWQLDSDLYCRILPGYV